MTPTQKFTLENNRFLLKRITNKNKLEINSVSEQKEIKLGNFRISFWFFFIFYKCFSIFYVFVNLMNFGLGKKRFSLLYLMFVKQRTRE